MTSKKEMTSMHPVWKRKDGVDMNKETEKDFEFQGVKINKKEFDKEMKAYCKTLVNENTKGSPLARGSVDCATYLVVARQIKRS